ncbi:hypothetical protein LguiB_017895 [Lonicera macranthoides]
MGRSLVGYSRDWGISHQYLKGNASLTTRFPINSKFNKPKLLSVSLSTFTMWLNLNIPSCSNRFVKLVK